MAEAKEIVGTASVESFQDGTSSAEDLGVDEERLNGILLTWQLIQSLATTYQFAPNEASLWDALLAHPFEIEEYLVERGLGERFQILNGVTLPLCIAEGIIRPFTKYWYGFLPLAREYATSVVFGLDVSEGPTFRSEYDQCSLIHEILERNFEPSVLVRFGTVVTPFDCSYRVGADCVALLKLFALLYFRLPSLGLDPGQMPADAFGVASHGEPMILNCNNLHRVSPEHVDLRSVLINFICVGRIIMGMDVQSWMHWVDIGPLFRVRSMPLTEVPLPLLKRGPPIYTPLDMLR